MKPEPKTTPSAGAVRATNEIIAIFLPECPKTWARAIAKIIDHETGAAKLADALDDLLTLIGPGDSHMPEAVKARAALAAWKECA